MDALETKYSTLWKEQKLQNYTVGGKVAGVYKNAGSLSYIRVYGAGHMVPAYSVRSPLNAKAHFYDET